MLRSPAIHFLVIGVALFALRSAGARKPERVLAPVDRTPIVIGADLVEDIVRGHTDTFGRPPDRRTLEYLVSKSIDEELCYREALAMGLDRADPAVRNRLLEKMEYLGEADADAIARDPAAVVDRAIELGLSRSDPLVRTAMIQKYRVLVRFSALSEASQAELHDYYERNLVRFEQPARVSFDHVFFSRQERGNDGATAAATALLRALRAEPGSWASLPAAGDVFLAGRSFERRHRRAVSQSFGPAFAGAIFALDVGGWTGPLSSSYGAHLVRVRDTSPAGTAPFESVLSQVRKGWADERRDARLRGKLDELRAIYRVEIDWASGKRQPR